MFLIKKWGILIKKESESLIFIGLKIPRDYFKKWEEFIMSKIQAVADAVAAGKAKLVGGLVQEALDDGCQAVDVLNAMIDAMGVVGERFKNNEIFVPEMLVAARAMKKGVEVLKPHLASGSAGVCGKMVIGTVAGDLHDLSLIHIYSRSWQTLP